MTPIGGITALMSIVIIIIRVLIVGVAKLFGVEHTLNQASGDIPERRPLSTFLSSLVLILITSSIVYSAVAIIYFGSREHNNLVFAKAFIDEWKYECIPPTMSDGDRAVVLRLDDVQAYGWSDVSQKLIGDTIAYGFPITAGVIPLNINTDPDIVHFLKTRACAIEIAIHGYDNQSYGTDTTKSGEFAQIDRTTAIDKLSRGRAELEQFMSDRINVFIPPENQLSPDAIVALPEQGFTIISSEGDAFFDYDAATYHFDEFRFIPADEVIRDCDAAFASGDNLCVVMLHPQDFVREDGSLEPSYYAEYIKLLTHLRDTGTPVITMNEARKRNMDITLFTEELSLGMFQTAVQDLQVLLNRFGYTIAETGNGSPGKESAYFGESTQDALKAFQRDHGIPETGVFDALTRRKITDRFIAAY